MAKNDAKKKKPVTIMSCADISSNFSKYVKTNDSKALLKGFRGLLLRERKEEEAENDENGRGKDAINDEEKFFSDAKRAMGLSDAIVKVGFMRSCGRVERNLFTRVHHRARWIDRNHTGRMHGGNCKVRIRSNRYDYKFQSQSEKTVPSSPNLSHPVQNQIHIEQQTPHRDYWRNLRRGG